ncbi:MAG TPA: FKBP-type peptidyl-prolyl cis-trans isomerase [Candidatus Sulfotelmatobacter sp.]|nr:FKBP-type peptidyl-prolyl cis-trans isomerase [Candidatus Sulfotelmatobacter sp.]
MSHGKWMLATAMVLLTPFAALAQDAAPELKTDKDKLSYALGMNFGENFRKQGVDVDPAVFAKAFAEAFNTGKTAMSEEDMKTVLTAAAQDIRKKQAAEQAVKSDQAQKDGEKFLADNKTKDSVVALPSGLQYKILKQGTGEKPGPDDTVICNYKGTLIDGTEFDASEKHGGPATFPVKGVIAGWTEALQLMPVGSKWQLFVPSSLAYGAQGPPGIGPNATLVFEVELVSIQKGAAPAAGGQPGSK